MISFPGKKTGIISSPKLYEGNEIELFFFTGDIPTKFYDRK